MNFSHKNIRELSSKELLIINAGDIGTGTSFAHDVAWLIGRGIRDFLDGLSGKYAGKDVVVLG